MLELKQNPFCCQHFGCNKKFKSQTSKLLHHHSEQEFCKEEKLQILQLICKFKAHIEQLMKGKTTPNFSVEGLRNITIYDNNFTKILDLKELN
jgi:hypothetical protein